MRLVLPETPPAFIITHKIDRRQARFKVDRFLKSKGLPLTGSPIYFKNIFYPYWQVESLLLRCRNKRERVVTSIDPDSGRETAVYRKKRRIFLSQYSTTIAAGSYFEGVPDSIGMRGQYLKLKPFSNSKVTDEVDVLKVVRNSTEILSTIELSLRQMNSIRSADFGRNLTKMFNPGSRLLYFPFTILEDYEGDGFKRYLLDGLSGRVLLSPDSLNAAAVGKAVQKSSLSSVLSIALSGESETEAEKSIVPLLAGKGIRYSESDNFETEAPQIEFGELQVELHRCHNCGENLPSQQSCIYICRNCQQLTCLEKKIKVLPKILKAETTDKEAEMFPFWSIPVSGKASDVLKKSLGAGSDFRNFTVPAFKITNLEAMYRLCKRALVSTDSFELEPVENLDNSFRGVDISPSEAFVLANAVYYRHWLEKFRKLPTEEISMNLREIRLCYLPFKAENYFYVDSILKSITFEKSIID